MKLKTLLILFGVLAGGYVLYLVFRKSQLPSNFSSLPAAQQREYLKMLDAANLWRAANPVNPYE